MLLVALLVYLTTSHKQQNVGLINPTQSPGLPFPSFLWSGINSFNLNRKGSEPGSSGRFNFHLHLPAHFTIPILSPWASVVSIPTTSWIKPEIPITFPCFHPFFRLGGASNLEHHQHLNFLQLLPHFIFNARHCRCLRYLIHELQPCSKYLL